MSEQRVKGLMGKVVFLGSEKSGKTSLYRSIAGLPKETYSPTFNAVLNYDVLTYQNSRVPVNIVDTSGNEIFFPILSHLAQLSNIGVIVGNSENLSTFKNFEIFYSLLSRLDIPNIYLVVNYKDSVKPNVTSSCETFARNKGIGLFYVNMVNDAGINEFRNEILSIIAQNLAIEQETFLSITREPAPIEEESESIESDSDIDPTINTRVVRATRVPATPTKTEEPEEHHSHKKHSHKGNKPSKHQKEEEPEPGCACRI